MRKVVRLFRWPLVVVVVLFLTAVGVLVMNPSWIRIETIQLELTDSSSENLLFQRIKKTMDPQYKHLEGKYFWQVSLATVFNLTLNDKRVKTVSISREFPSRLRVVIEPYTPVLAYLSGDGRIYPIATDATMLPALPAIDAPDIPILRGEELKDEPSLRAAAIELYRGIPESGDFSKKQISEIVYSKKEGFKIYVSGTSNGKTSEVRMGDTDFGPKISRVQKVLSYLDSQNIKGRVIDARFSKKVVVRVRNTP